MDEALRVEQERQMKMMSEKKTGKGKELARVKLERQLKMAEIQK